MQRITLIFTLTLIVCFAAPARADRPAVELVLEHMERAVLAGNIPDYLKHIATDDPIFLEEQQNWAADLKLHVPTLFDLSIFEPEPVKSPSPDTKPDMKPDTKPAEVSSVRPPVFNDQTGIATFELRMDWTMPNIGRDGKDISRTISYPAIFARVRDAQGDEHWVFKGEEWSSIESSVQMIVNEDSHLVSKAPNRCLFYPGFEDTAANVVAILPEVRAHVDSGFENVIEHVQEVKIYPSMRHLQASIYLSYVDGLSGWNEPGESIKLLASKNSGKDRLRPLLAHEYGHVATFELGEHSNNMPWWVLEGVAELSAERYMSRPDADANKLGVDAKLMVESWAKSGKLAAWADITDFRSTKKDFGGHVYKQGQHMLGYISERFGRSKRNAWIRAMAQGSTIDEATKLVLDMSFTALDEAWRASLPAVEADKSIEDFPPS